MTELAIYATVSGNVQQYIELDIDIDKNEFVDGLKSGKYVTTISHGDGNGCVIQIQPEFKLIGRVVAQEALDDVELAEYELCEQ